MLLLKHEYLVKLIAIAKTMTSEMLATYSDLTNVIKKVENKLPAKGNGAWYVNSGTKNDLYFIHIIGIAA